MNPRVAAVAAPVMAFALALVLAGCSIGEPVTDGRIDEEITFVANGRSRYAIALRAPGASSDTLDWLRASLDCEITTADGEPTVDTGNVNASVVTVNDTTRWHTFTPPEGRTTVRCYQARGGGFTAGEARILITLLDD